MKDTIPDKDSVKPRVCKCGHVYGCHWGFTGKRNPCHHHNIETGEWDCNCDDFEEAA